MCRSSNTLEIAPGLQGVPIYSCGAPRCGFTGDGVEIFAAARKLNIEAAVYELVSAGVIPGDPGLHGILEDYLMDRRGELNGPMGWWKRANQKVLRGSTHAAGILQARGCWHGLTSTSGPHGLGPFLGVATGTEIQALVEERLYMLQGWRHYLVTPFWGDPRTITGFSCLSEEGDAVSVHLDNRSKAWGFGFLHTTGVRSERVLITNHPLTAMETLANAMASGVRLGVIYAHERSDTWGSLYARRRIFLNTSGALATFKQALGDPQALVVAPADLKKGQPQELMTPQARLAHLESCGSVVHVALGNFLSSLSNSEAKASVIQLGLSIQDIARVISGVSEVSRGRLQDLFNEVVMNQSVRYNGDTISMAPEGWVSQKKGVISNTVFLVDRVVCDAWNNQQLAMGVVIQNRKQFAFQVPVVQLKKPEIWLTEFMAAQRGDFVHVTQGWGPKLYDISLQFRQPSTEHSVVTTGWANEGRRLVLPGVSIEAGSIEPMGAPLRGPGAGLRGMGPPGSWEIPEALKETPEAALFWALFAAITVNVFVGHHNHGTSGIALVDAKGYALDAVVNDAVAAIGLERVVFASTSAAAMKEIKNKELKGVLPLYVDELWSKSRGFSQWQKLDTHRNAVVSMSKPVAIASSLCGEWIYIGHKGTPVTPGIKEFTGYWNLLPEFWAYLQVHGTWESTRSSVVRGLLMGPLQAWLRTLGCETPPAVKAAMELVTVDLVAAQAPWGYRFLGLLIESARAGCLRSMKTIETDDMTSGLIVDDAGDTVFIAKSTVQELLVSLGVEPPGYKEISDRLAEASCLLGQRYRGTQGFLLPLDRWNLCWSMKL